MIAAIQAGGRSSRMGEDKAWLKINGRPMIESVLAAAQTVADQLLIVIHPTNPKLARYEELVAQWQAKLVFDLHDHRGPLGGLETALRQGTDAVLLLACDLPFVTAEFLQLLGALHTAEKNEVTVPLDNEEQPQMLAAIYAATCLPHVAAMLTADELKMRWLLSRVRARQVTLAEYAHLTNAEHLLRNINTPDDFQTSVAL